MTAALHTTAVALVLTAVSPARFGGARPRLTARGGRPRADKHADVHRAPSATAVRSPIPDATHDGQHSERAGAASARGLAERRRPQPATHSARRSRASEVGSSSAPSTLEDAVVGLWEDLRSADPAECLVCGGSLRSTPAGGECGSCGSSLT